MNTSETAMARTWGLRDRHEYKEGRKSNQNRDAYDRHPRLEIAVRNTLPGTITDKNNADKEQQNRQFCEETVR